MLVESKDHTKTQIRKVIWKPGEEAVYQKKMTDLQVNRFNAKFRLAWQAQDIYFENAGIEEVLRNLERFYGVSFDTIPLKPRYWHLSGEYNNQTLKDVWSACL